jgi:DNA repair exonuclease SbcCD ATPase subunit
MWYPVKIEFGGLFAFRDRAEVVFNRGECTVIFGDNQTDRGSLNNGSGKSTLFEAVALALTGDLLPRDSAITRDKAINRQSDEAWVTMSLANDVLHQTMEIRRRFYRKKSAKATLFENGTENTQLTSVAEVDKRVLELLGLSRDDLLRYYIISQDRQYNFLTAPDATKKEILNRITNADMLQPVLDAIKADYKAATERVAEYETQILTLDTRRETLEENLAELKANTSAAANIAGLTGLLEGYIKDATAIGIQAKEIRAEFEAEKVKREQFERQLESAPNFEEDIATADNAITTIKNDRKKNRRAKADLELALEGVISCPKCGEQFIPNSEMNLAPDQIRRIIAQRERDDERFAIEIKKAEGNLEALEEKQRDYEQAAAELTRVKRNMTAIRERADRLKRQMDETDRRKADLEKRIAEYKHASDNDASVKAAEAKIKAVKAEIKSAKAELADFRYLAESLSFWDFHMGKNGFLTYLANKALKVLEGMTNLYLEKFGMDVTVLINGFTLTKDGNVRDKIDVYIQSDGLNADVYGIHSGAERGRVALASLIGLNRLINMSTDGRGLDMILLDEAFHGIDSLGQEHIIRTLENVGITSMMITQNVSADFAAKNKLIVRKIDKVSKYDH